MNTRPIRFFHRGQIVQVDGAAPTRTVLDWLREDARCTGTKEGCAEGDCGACTVVVGTPHGDRLDLRTVNACIQFLPTLDGRALFTVEDLSAAEGALHPVQQAMVDCHGSQCGFCTPGFVMSLWSVYERAQASGRCPSRQQLADDLSGNLCRCTGYRPILDAGERMMTLPRAAFDPKPALEALRALDDTPLTLETAAGRFHAPRSIEALATLYAERPQARLLAGSTDIGLWVNKQFRALPEIIYLGRVAGLDAVTERADGTLEIGGGATLEAAWQALHARHPELRDVWLRFASPPVRNVGTLGGNVANGSPIGDGAPVLMALGASLVLRRGERVRRLPLDEFYLDYMKNRLEPGEFVQAIELPRLACDTIVRAYKVSKRFDSDISALCMGVSMRVADGVLHDVRIACGGMAAVVKRARSAEAALQGQRWTEETLLVAQAALANDYAPITDLRASYAYRMTVVRNLLRRLWLETRPGNPLPADQSNVWAIRPHATTP